MEEEGRMVTGKKVFGGGRIEERRMVLRGWKVGWRQGNRDQGFIERHRGTDTGEERNRR